jgi:hypothetical protein
VERALVDVVGALQPAAVRGEGEDERRGDGAERGVGQAQAQDAVHAVEVRVVAVERAAEARHGVVVACAARARRVDGVGRIYVCGGTCWGGWGPETEMIVACAERARAGRGARAAGRRGAAGRPACRRVRSPFDRLMV